MLSLSRDQKFFDKSTTGNVQSRVFKEKDSWFEEANIFVNNSFIVIKYQESIHFRISNHGKLSS